MRKQDKHELKTLCASHLDSHNNMEKWVLLYLFFFLKKMKKRDMAVKYWSIVELLTKIIINYSKGVIVSGVREPAQTSS